MKRHHVVVVVLSALAVIAFYWWPADSVESGPAADSGASDDGSAANIVAEPSDAAESADEDTTLADKPLAERVPAEEQAYFMEFADDGEFYEMLRPGDRVDIVGFFELKDGAKKPEEDDEQKPHAAIMLLQNVTVLGIYPHPESPDEGAAVAVSVTTDELNMLRVSEAGGDLDVLVRHEDDVALTSIKRHTLRSMLEDLEVIQRKRRDRRAKSVEEGNGDEIEIIRGADGTVERKLEDDKEIVDSESSPDVSCAGPMASRVPASKSSHGLRAVYVDASLPAGTVGCGDRVNVYAVFKVYRDKIAGHGSEGSEPFAVTLLQDVSVLDVVGADSIEGLVLATKDNEYMLLELADLAGELEFALRHPDDNEIGQVREKTLRDALENILVIPDGRRKRIPPDVDIEIISGDR